VVRIFYEKDGTLFALFCGENFSIGGKTKTSFLEFSLGTQIGKIPVAATLKNQNTEKLFYLFYFNNATVYAFTFQNTK